MAIQIILKHLTDYLQNDPHFTPLIALTLMLFILIYPPCIAALAVIKRETGSWKWMLFMFCYENAFAWIACFIFYNIGLALGFYQSVVNHYGLHSLDT